MSFIAYNKAFEKNNKLVLFDELLKSIILKGNFEDFCFILATNRLVHYLKLEVAENLFNVLHKPLTNFEAMNLEAFILKAFNYFFPHSQKKIVSEAFRFVLFVEAYETANLMFYPQNTQKKNLFLIKWLSDIIFGLKEDGIKPEKMVKEIESLDPQVKLRPKYSDTYKIYTKYEEILNKSGFIDKTDLINYVNNILKQITNDQQPVDLPFFSREKTIVFFGFYDFKQPELELLGLLKDFVNPIAIYLDFDEKNGPLFGNYIQILSRLVSMGYLIKDFSTENFDKAKEPYSIFIRRYLFNNFEHLSNSNLADFIQIYSAENRFEEVKYIVRLCKYLIQVKGIAPKDICILIKKPEKYSTIFREAFAEAEVPANITERFRLNSSPLVISILVALNVVVKGFYYSDIRKALQSYYFDFHRILSCGKEEAIDIDNFLYVVSTLKIIGGESFGGKKYWDIRFQSRIDYLEKRLNNLKNSLIDDETEVYELETSLRKIKKAYEDLKILFSYFDFQNIEYTPDEFYNIVYNKIIRGFGVLKKISNIVDHTFEDLKTASRYDKLKRIEEMERDSRALVRFIKLLEELVYIFKESYQSKKFKLSKYLEYLKLMVYNERFQISRKVNFGVTVTTIEQTRGISFRVMILCGMVDGEFPIRYNPVLFLGKELKRSEARHFENERLEFFFFLSNAPKILDRGEKLIYIFYPKSDSKYEFVPSVFVNYLLDLVGERKSELIADINTIRKTPILLKVPKHQWIQYYASRKDFTLANYSPSMTLSFNDDSKLNTSQLTCKAYDYLVNKTKEPISASFLEEYVKCPFKFFVKKVLGIREPVASFDFFLSNLEKGLIMHYVVASFYREVSIENIDKNPHNFTTGEVTFVPVNLNPEKKSYYLSVLKNKTEEILDRFDYHLQYFEIDRTEFLGSEEGKVGLIPLWLNYELKRFSKNGWKYRPAFSELQFGIGKSGLLKPVEVKDNEGNTLFKLKGKIDRVDFNICLLDNDKKFDVLITDYKLNKSECRKLSEALSGKTFQMFLYAISFEEILKRHFQISPSKIQLAYQIFDYISDEETYRDDNLIFFYGNIDEEKSVKNKAISKTFDYYDLKKIVIKNVIEVLSKISVEPSFPVKPMNQFSSCTFCRFKTICRKEVS